jgi:hypothetical protein
MILLIYIDLQSIKNGWNVVKNVNNGRLAMGMLGVITTTITEVNNDCISS